ncbi:hypothetical protein SMGES_16220 [Serratia marcescens]|nr:hypothetical protein SMGES_16220 [Serratia marcescens]GJK51669.1 hypothetical protein TUM17560_40460 [Serratia marcescens]
MEILKNKRSESASEILEMKAEAKPLDNFIEKPTPSLMNIHIDTP